MAALFISLLSLLSVVRAHQGGHHSSAGSASPSSGGHPQPNPWADEFGQVGDLSFSGATSFAHLPSPKCLDQPDEAFDIALIGIPFDSAVSYRPGASLVPVQAAHPLLTPRLCCYQELALDRTPFVEVLAVSFPPAGTIWCSRPILIRVAQRSCVAGCCASA